MKKFYLFLFIVIFSVSAFAQKPKPAPRKPAAAKSKTAGDEKGDFEKAVAQTDLTQKIAALQKFTADYPNSAEKTHALELIVTSRAQLGDEKLRSGETSAGIELFKQAVADAPAPMSDKFFSEVVLQFPTNLFYRGQQDAASEIAKAIEEKIGGNAKQILGLATFYLGTEDADEAQRLANKAIAIDAQLPAAYQTLGLATRLGFQLDDAVAAYTKAAELDPNSIVSKRSLAEMKRAVGKPDEAAAIYRELFEKNADDAAAQTGLILALFDAGKQTEAEAEMSKSLEKNPNNLPLLVGAAYWYAAKNEAEKAIDYAGRAVALEPRYTWAHIALAHGLLLQKRYTDAERQILAAQQYGNFPTLVYELAAIRLAAGFYEEAAQELKKGFAVTDTAVITKLGNRIPVEGKDFIEAIALERRASIFQPLAADSAETAERLRALFVLNQKLAAAESKDEDIERAVNEFVKGSDKNKTHRQLYAADTLLRAKKDLPKVLELTQAAISGVDAALESSNAPSAILADELIESRMIAISRGEVIVVPDVPRQTLSAILRGRIEAIAGWTLFNQDKPQEAVIRLKRAVSVLPEKSAWWRSSLWRLGAALDASGKSSEALDAYVKSYTNSAPDVVKYSVIEAVYQKVNGNLDGLDKKIGAKPADASFVAVNTPPPTATPNAETSVKVEPTPTPAPTAEPTTSEPTPSSTPTPEATPKSSETPASENAEAKQKVVLTPAPTPEIKAAESNSKTTAKPSSTPLFNPIVITVPKAETIKSPKLEASVEKSSETKAKDTTATDNSGETRSRITNKQNTETSNAEPTQCQIDVNQETVTIVANGGNLGVLVGYKDEGDITKITASSSSPADVDVALDPDIGRQSNRLFFVIKSTSTKTGIFTITFDSPCGKKEISVKVR